MEAIADQPPTIKPTEAEIRLARESGPRLNHLLSRMDGAGFGIIVHGVRDEEVPISSSVFRTLLATLAEIAKGNAVSVVPIETELSTQKAADLLNVSRPHLIGLLESGAMPYRKVGTHRRVRYADVIEYRHRSDQQGDRAYDEMLALSRELGLYD